MTQILDRSARTLLFTGPRRAEIGVQTVAAPGPDEVLVTALATGISAGTELNVYRGTAPQWRKRQDPQTRLFVPGGNAPDWQYPVAYGYACVGRIVETGAGVTDRSVGDLVFAYAPHRALSVAKAARTIPLPDGLLNPDLAVMLSNLNTAYNGVLDARPMLGADLVVFGQGVVGQLVTRLFARTGPRRLIVVDRIASRRDLALKGGATHALDPADHVAEAVRELTQGRGADIAVEVSGAPAALNEAIRTVGVDGTVLAMSWYGGSFEGLDLMGEFHHNRVRIRSSQVGAVDPELGPLWSVPRRMGLALEALRDLPGLDQLVTHRAPVADGPALFELLDTRPDEALQVILTYPQGAA